MKQDSLLRQLITGRGAIAGMAAIVPGDVPTSSVLTGNPARIVRPS